MNFLLFDPNRSWAVYVDGAIRHYVACMRDDTQEHIAEIRRLYESVYPGSVVVVK